MIHFIDNTTRSVPDELASAIRRHVQARFDRREQTVVDYGYYAGWDHSQYALDVNQPTVRDPELLALLERAARLYHQDALDFARVFEQSQHQQRQVVHDLKIVSAFVTRYLPGHKEIADHEDLCDLTLIVDLSDADFAGGGVSGAEESPWNQVRLHSGERGCAVLIGKDVTHKTISLRSGRRWIMVVFYHYV